MPPAPGLKLKRNMLSSRLHQTKKIWSKLKSQERKQKMVLS
uniref:Uncharacterized protein n=1 Tax=Brassica oleracea TaxID=3712 RepID=A0A3P6C768_BRAOL|nr:unnamed protein product [Brassica oleracea]